MKDKTSAIIKGTNCDGEHFEERVDFTLLLPDEKTAYYGTGCHMRVATPSYKEVVDVRYERTTDVDVLADRWIKNYYGKNAEEVTMCPVA